MDDVRKQSDEAKALNANTDLINALLGGSEGMRKGGTTYLPQETDESPEDWQYRLATATLYPAFERTVEILAAKPFSKPLKPAEDTPEDMLPWIESVDAVGKKGRNLHSFAASVCQDAIAFGFAGILVDYPKTDGIAKNAAGIATKEDIKKAGVRPYFVQIKAENILGWEPSDATTVDELTQLRILEQASVSTGQFSSKKVDQVRVLERGSWQVWRQSGSNSTQWVIFDQGVTTLPTIPFVPVYGKFKGFMQAVPPMLALAEQNKDHWRESSDQRDSVRFCRKRMVVLIGADTGDEPVTASANYMIKLPQGGDIKIIQGSAESVKIGRDELNTLEEQMRQAGSEMLIMRPGQITATQTNSESAGNLSALQRIAHELDDKINTALQFMAEWAGMPEGGHVSVFKDFGATTLAEASADLLLRTTVAGEMSSQSLYEEYQRRGIRSGEITWEEEKKRIAADRDAADLEPPSFAVKPVAVKVPADE